MTSAVPPAAETAGTAFVLLAAGAGTRYHGQGHKLLAPIADGMALATRAMATMAAAVDQFVGEKFAGVVTGAVELPVWAGLTTLVNAEWATGQATSLQVAVAAAAQRGCGRVVVGLADQPFVTVEAWLAVATAESARPIVVATYGGRRGNPVRLDRAVWPQLPHTGDEGARAVMRVRPDLVGEVPCTGSPADIDTVEDLRRWPNS